MKKGPDPMRPFLGRGPGGDDVVFQSAVARGVKLADLIPACAVSVLSCVRRFGTQSTQDRILEERTTQGRGGDPEQAMVQAQNTSINNLFSGHLRIEIHSEIQPLPSLITPRGLWEPN